MNNCHILVLHSDLDSYKYRIEQIANNPTLDGILLCHCMVIDTTRDNSRCKELHMEYDNSLRHAGNALGGVYKRGAKRLMEEIMYNEVAPIVEEKITAFEVDTVIIHAGFAFRWVPEAYFKVIKNLGQKHPGLRFALQGKKAWLSSRSKGEEALKIQTREYFIDDDKLERIIEQIF